MNKNKLSYLITFRESNSERTRVLDYILQQIIPISNVEVCLVEQDSQPRLLEQVERYNDSSFNYIFVKNSGSFNKAWGLNIAARESTGEQLIFADADILLTTTAFQSIKNELANRADAINPYSVLVDLSSEETSELLAEQSSLDLERTTEQLNRIERGQHIPFCGGIFAITRQLFETCGGMDERFESWGGDDDVMSIRVSNFATNLMTLDEVAYHLWHGTEHQAKNNQEAYIRNLALLSMYHEHDNEFYSSLAEQDVQTIANHNKYQATEKESNQQINSNIVKPTISCLCVTRCRVTELKRAVACFHAQDYPNKELCLVIEDDDQDTVAYVKELNHPSISVKILSTNPKLTLGELRNVSLAMASGDYFCQWDDDDWYHPSRLSYQLACAMKNRKAASVLPRWLIFDQVEDQAYCSNVRLWEGSLLCKKDILPNANVYKSEQKGEDSALIAWLYGQDQIAIEDRPELYVYHVSGANTWEQNHFQKILNASQKLTAKESEMLKKKMKF